MKQPSRDIGFLVQTFAKIVRMSLASGLPL